MKKMQLLILLAILSLQHVYGQSPGGISTGLQLWLDANTATGTTTLSAWNDRTGLNTFSLAGSLGYQSAGLNFKPTVSFTNTYVNTTTAANRLDGNTNISYVDGFTVFKWSSATNGTLIGSTVTATDYGPAIFSGDVVNLYVGNGTNQGYSHIVFNDITNFHIANLDVSPASPTYVSGRLDGIAQNIVSNVYSRGDFSSIAITPRLGSTNNNGRSTGWYPYQGQIAEIVLYNTSLSVTDKNKVESYLALKYGLTLGNATTPVNYTSSEGTVIWTGNATYQYDVFGIGIDNGSGVSVTQSNSMNTGGADGTGQTGKGNIKLTTTGLTNNDFVMMGHSNAALSFTNTDVPASLGANFRRTERSWKSQRTNFATGNFTLEFNFSGLGLNNPADPSSFKLLVNPTENGVFSAASVVDPSSVSATSATFNLTPANFSGTTFAFATTLGVLPLKFGSFTGTVTAAGSQLQWEVPDGLDAGKYEVEYSTNGRDFSTLTTILHRTGTHSYSYLHAVTKPGVYYYRIAGIGKDGIITYSETKMLRISGLQHISISPNPVGQYLQLQLKLKTTTTATLRLFNMEGKEIQRMSRQLQGGIQNIEMDMRGFSKGMYQLRVTLNDETTTLSVVKK